VKYAYYPGCSLHSTAKEYDLSTKEVASALGIELVEIPGWACCGATPAHLTVQSLSIALPVKNLLQAKNMDAGDVVTCCAACFSRLKIANHFMETEAEKRKEVEGIVGERYEGEVKARHFLEVLTSDFGLSDLKAKVAKELKGLKVACYYGCLLTRPKGVTGIDDLEDPRLLDDLMSTIGVEPVKWPYKTECCGASFSLSKTEIVLKLSGDILEMASDEGAEAIVVACPLCQSNLDLRQGMINKKLKKNFDIPVFYFTQLVALSLGVAPGKLGFDKHMVDPVKLLKKKGIIG
jgi:heterodisulfide reductase subunit B